MDPEEGVLAALSMAFPQPLQAALHLKLGATQEAVMALPCANPVDLAALQGADPELQTVMAFWTRQKRSCLEERQQLTKPARALLRQWEQLVMRDGVLHHWVLRPAGKEPVFQLVVPMWCLRWQVCVQLHQAHGHQGIECTLELIRQRCYWPGMFSEVRLLSGV